MRLGQIHPPGIAHPLTVHLANGVVDVYTPSGDDCARILSIAPNRQPLWDNGWGTDDLEVQEAVFESVQALCACVVRVCEQ